MLIIKIPVIILCKSIYDRCLTFSVERKWLILKIEKVLNNNVAQVHDHKGKQFVVMGRGLAFQKKIGEDIEPASIEKKYILQSTENNFAEIYDELSSEEIDVVSEIIQLAEEDLNQEFQGNLFVTLGDHIHFAVETTKNNQTLKNPLAWEVKRLYKKEYQVGLKALAIIEKRLGVHFDRVEAASIALHFINAQKKGSRLEHTISNVKIIEDVIKIVELHYSERFSDESISFGRFVTHLQYFAERINTGKIYQGKDDTFLYDQVKENYSQAFVCSEKIKKFVESAYDYPVGREEQVYLTIHIQRLVK